MFILYLSFLSIFSLKVRLVSEYYDSVGNSPSESRSDTPISISSDEPSVYEVPMRSPSVISISSGDASIYEPMSRSPTTISMDFDELSLPSLFDENGVLESGLFFGM